jgi:hypothetical protein
VIFNFLYGNRVRKNLLHTVFKSQEKACAYPWFLIKFNKNFYILGKAVIKNQHAKILNFVSISFLAGFICVSLFSSKPAAAAINRQINFQGKIVNKTGGTNVTNGTYNMQFKIYSGGNGVPGGGDETLLWTETRLRNNSQGVVFTDGVFQVNLGSITTLPGSVDFNNSTLWLSMEVGNTNASCTPFSSCSPDGEMDPMVRFTATPYSFNADLLDGIDSTAFGQLANAQTWAATQTLQPTTNVTSAIVRQTSAGSPTADIFNVQTANNTNVIQVTGPAANEAAVSITSVGSGRDITFTSADQIFLNSVGTIELQDSTNVTGNFSVSADTTLTGNVGIGAAASGYKLDLRTAGSTASQVHIASTATDAGGYLSSLNDANFLGSAGAAYNGTNWVAKTAGTVIWGSSGFGPFSVYVNSGLTVGNTFTPTERFSVNASGDITSTGDLNVNGGDINTTASTLGINATGSGADLDVNVNDALTVDAASMTFTLAAGTTDFTIAGIDGDSNLILPGMAGANAIMFAAPTTGIVTTASTSTGSQCLISGAGGTGTPSWGSCAGGSTPDLDAVYAQSITNTNLNMEVDNAGGLTFDLTTTGDFAVRDGTTAFATFANTGAITFAPTSGQSLTNTIAGAGTLTNTISGTGNAIFNLTSTGDFVIQDNGTAALTVDDSGNVTLGVSDTTGTVLTLDTKTGAGDPTGSDGAMYYNSDSKNFRCRHNGLWQDCDFASLRSEWTLQEDFIDAGVATATIGTYEWTLTDTGSATEAKVNASTDASNRDRFGIYQTTTAATAGSGNMLRLDNNAMTGTPSNLTLEFDFGPSNAAAANGTQTVVRIGLHNGTTTSADPTDGIYFEYNTTTTAGNWFRCTQNNNTTTCTDTGVARTTTLNTYQRFRFATNSAGTTVEFFINEASVGTNSTNLPANTRPLGPAIGMHTVDAVARAWKIDYFQIKRNLTTLR